MPGAAAWWATVWKLPESVVWNTAVRPKVAGATFVPLTEQELATGVMAAIPLVVPPVPAYATYYVPWAQVAAAAGLVIESMIAGATHAAAVTAAVRLMRARRELLASPWLFGSVTGVYSRCFGVLSGGSWRA